jgi:Ca2+:H+ antiporter
MIASLFGMVMLTYSYNEGKSNYFKGAVLTFVYIILIFSFAFVPGNHEVALQSLYFLKSHP